MSALIEPEDISKSKEREIPMLTSSAANFFLIGQATALIDQLIEKVQEHECIHFISEGTFSLHELISGLIRKINSPYTDLYITTWAISEDPLRSLASLKDEKLVDDIFFLFDEKVKDRQLKPYQLASGIARKIVLEKCHAKIVVIESGEKSFVISGSMNWTRNPRLETGFVSRNSADVNFYLNYLQSKFDEIN